MWVNFVLYVTSLTLLLSPLKLNAECTSQVKVGSSMNKKSDGTIIFCFFCLRLIYLHILTKFIILKIIVFSLFYFFLLIFFRMLFFCINYLWETIFIWLRQSSRVYRIFYNWLIFRINSWHMHRFCSFLISFRNHFLPHIFYIWYNHFLIRLFSPYLQVKSTNWNLFSYFLSKNYLKQFVSITNLYQKQYFIWNFHFII